MYIHIVILFASRTCTHSHSPTPAPSPPPPPLPHTPLYILLLMGSIHLSIRFFLYVFCCCCCCCLRVFTTRNCCTFVANGILAGLENALIDGYKALERGARSKKKNSTLFQFICWFIYRFDYEYNQV